MLLGVIADDFTGASDIANTIAQGIGPVGGLKTALFLGIPESDAPTDAEAGVIALKSRSIPAADAIAQALEALAWLRAQGCYQFVFKYCSTFDSTPAGNIGPVAEALAQALEAEGVVVCPAFPAAGRTVYQGHLFVKDRLLNESGLEHHPLNPMTDPDIRRWLRLQVQKPVGHLAWPNVSAGAQIVRAGLKAAIDRGERLVVVDALTEQDLVSIGHATADHPLVTGGSAIALALPDNFIKRGLARGCLPRSSPISGPEVILAGSCSSATRLQIEHHSQSHPALALDVDSVMRADIDVSELAAFVLRNQGKSPLIHSAADPAAIAGLQKRYGREALSQGIEMLFAELAAALVSCGIRRLVVAGGETSGAVVRALDLEALSIGPEIDPGVPVLVSTGERPIALALKSGNFGAPDFFARALRRLAGK